VHARHAAIYSKREADVQRLLDDGVTADLGERWNAIVAASVALAATPIAFAGACGPSRRSGLTIWPSPTSSTLRRSSTGPSAHAVAR
jgi:hypothetical protein